MDIHSTPSSWEEVRNTTLFSLFTSLVLLYFVCGILHRSQCGTYSLRFGLPSSNCTPLYFSEQQLRCMQVLTVQDGESFISFYPGPTARVTGALLSFVQRNAIIVHPCIA